MVGQMHSRLGILRFYLNYEHNVYTIKEDYLGIVKMVLTPFSMNWFEVFCEMDMPIFKKSFGDDPTIKEKSFF